MPIPAKKEDNVRISAKERIYRSLRQWITDGTMEPNERLNDVELAEYFSVSRTPVREALQLLSQQNLVQIVPSNGTFVAPIDRENMKYVYEMLAALSVISLEMCYDKLTPQHFIKMTALNEIFLQHIDTTNLSAIHQADYDFHHYLCEISGNPYLLDFFSSLYLQVVRNENFYFKGAPKFQASYTCHQGIISALQNGDLKKAQTLIADNWHSSIPSETE